MKTLPPVSAFSLGRWEVSLLVPDDALELVSFKRKLMEHTYQEIVSPGSLLDELSACNEEHVLRDIVSPSSLVLGARDGSGALAGTASLRVESDEQARLFGWFVAEPQRGLGGSLARTLILQASDGGLSRLVSYVYRGNSSGVRALSSLGFAPSGLSRPGTFMPRQTVEEYQLIV